MKRVIAASLQKRYGPVVLFVLLACCISLLTRLALLVYSIPNLTLNPLHYLGVFGIGLFYDLVFCSFAVLPIAIFCWLQKDSWYRGRVNKWLLYGLFFLAIFLLLVNAGAEFAFWDEFGVRFNFIAVDYLIYTTEVIGNIIESYNIPLIIGALLAVTILVLWFLRRYIKLSLNSSMRFGSRSKWFGIYLCAGLASYFLVNNQVKNFSRNNYINELAGNGLYEFGVAFWHNEIPFEKFYLSLPDEEAFRIVQAQLSTDSTVVFDSLTTTSRKLLVDSSTANKKNLVLISVESFSGDFMRAFGDTIGMTPYLDSLAQHSLFFTQCYANGTRTVRGLEALSLCIPPTPGQSIVRRPNNENLFTVGSILKNKGYDCRYVYGGNGFFDNMNYFFGNNGYDIVDIATIKKETPIHHETTWGVADEDLFTQALKECDKSHHAGKPFFNHVMTVSNHRPYTYPDGRIDIPSSKQMREGAMKYCDWAINDFLKRAQTKPWFKNTIFVIVADHCAKSAGKTDLPIPRYHIPCMIYAPGIVTPQKMERPLAQIDIGPTVLDMMDIDYASKFFGYNILRLPAGRERFFISTYTLLGYVKHDTLTILEPQKIANMYKVNLTNSAAQPIAIDSAMLKEAIAWYQTASYVFKNQLYKK
jgi:phosphoglycerol transferase MdoB-like AlkP superfamily enzyme